MEVDVTAWPKWPMCLRAVVFNDQGKVLLLKRNAVTSLFPGAWNLPGGGQEDNETAYQGCVLELLEETGISGQPDGRSHAFGFPGGSGVAFGFRHPSGRLQINAESVEGEWFDPKDLPNPLMPGTAETIEAFKGLYGGNAKETKRKMPSEFWTDSATPFHDLPIFHDRNHSNEDRGTLWRIRCWCTPDGSGKKKKIDWSKYAMFFAWVDPNKKDRFGGYKLKIGDVIHGKAYIVANGVISAAGLIMGARKGVDIPPEDRAAVKRLLGR